MNLRIFLQTVLITDMIQSQVQLLHLVPTLNKGKCQKFQLATRRPQFPIGKVASLVHHRR